MIVTLYRYNSIVFIVRNYDTDQFCFLLFLEQSSSKASCSAEIHPEPVIETIGYDAVKGKAYNEMD